MRIPIKTSFPLKNIRRFPFDDILHSCSPDEAVFRPLFDAVGRYVTPARCQPRWEVWWWPLGGVGVWRKVCFWGGWVLTSTDLMGWELVVIGLTHDVAKLSTLNTTRRNTDKIAMLLPCPGPCPLKSLSFWIQSLSLSMSLFLWFNRTILRRHNFQSILTITLHR